MESINLDERSVADGAPDQGRREALKRFGRYAAVAPTAMLLLSARSGHALHKPGHKPKPGGDGY